MPLTKEQIRKQKNDPDAYVSPHHGDGGWHGSTFASEKFDSDWQPLNDRILIRLIPAKLKYESIIRPESAASDTTSRHAIVLRVGPGARVEDADGETVRRPLDVKPGDEVIIGRWHDWEGFNGQCVLCQEADVRVIVKRKAAAA